MTLHLDLEQLRHLARTDTVRAGVLRRHLEARRDALLAGDFTDLPPNVHVEAWAHELDEALKALGT